MAPGTEKIVNKKQFASLIKAADEAKTKVSSINGTIGERIKEASENGHLHPGAFKAILKLYRADAEKRDSFLRAFDLYRDMARELNLFQEHVGDIDDLARAAAAEEEQQRADEDAQVAENLKNLEGIKPLDGDAAEFDDATSSKPSRRRKGSVGDADGSYKITH